MLFENPLQEEIAIRLAYPEDRADDALVCVKTLGGVLAGIAGGYALTRGFGGWIEDGTLLHENYYELSADLPNLTAVDAFYKVSEVLLKAMLILEQEAVYVRLYNKAYIVYTEELSDYVDARQAMMGAP